MYIQRSFLNVKLFAHEKTNKDNICKIKVISNKNSSNG